MLFFSRSANKEEIIHAYRQQAKKWHPDKYRKDWEKRKAGKRFIDITSAKQVLTDPGTVLYMHLIMLIKPSMIVFRKL